MDTLIIALAAFGAGIMNAVAGGGSFLTFPALVFTGVPSIIANASSTVALFPGSFASAWAYRQDFRPVASMPLRPMLAVSLIGGVLGAVILLVTPQSIFDGIVPWLLLIATLAFTFGRQLTPILRRYLTIGPKAVLGGQFVVAIYGGYFGGAVGIIQLALYALLGETDLNAMNATKTIMSGTMNAAAVVCFVIAGTVWWPQSLIMMAAGIAGGYVGARVARKLDPRWVRHGVTAIGVVMTVAFFRR
jgi:uncharacterized membrane protein YfcA